MVDNKGIVLVVEDDDSVRRSLERLLGCNEFRVRAFGTGREFIEAEPPNEPHCLLLDLQLGDMDGFDIMRHLNANGRFVPTVFLTAFGDVPDAVQAMRLGADDFFIKPYVPADLIAALRRALVHAAATWQDNQDLNALRQRAERLTPRERQIVTFVYDGLLSKEIATKLGLSEVTIKIHRARAMRRLGARTPAQLARMLQRLGWADHAG
jgi:FixJ family two-component response regulator